MIPLKTVRMKDLKNEGPTSPKVVRSTNSKLLENGKRRLNRIGVNIRTITETGEFDVDDRYD
jgi:hypothetical protein